MRKPNQILDNKEIKRKILDYIHFGYAMGGVSYSDPEKERKLAIRDKHKEEIMLLLKVYKHCADNVVKLNLNVSDAGDFYYLQFFEAFDNNYGTTKYTTINMYK